MKLKCEIPMNKYQLDKFIINNKLKLAKVQPINDYRDWYIDEENNLFVFYSDYCSNEYCEYANETEMINDIGYLPTYVTLYEIIENHKDEIQIYTEEEKKQISEGWNNMFKYIDKISKESV